MASNPPSTMWRRHGGRGARAWRRRTYPVTERREALKRGDIPLTEAETRFQNNYFARQRKERERELIGNDAENGRAISPDLQLHKFGGLLVFGNAPRPEDQELSDIEWEEGEAGLPIACSKARSPRRPPSPPQNAITCARDSPLVDWAVVNLPGFHGAVSHQSDTACQFLAILRLFENLATRRGFENPGKDFPISEWTTYAVGEDCEIPVTGMIQLWPGQDKDGSWFSSGTLNALIKFDIREVNAPTRRFLDADEMTIWFSPEHQYSAERQLRDMLAGLDTATREDGRLALTFVDTQHKDKKQRTVRFPTVSDEVNTLLFPYIPCADHWVAVEITAEQAIRGRKQARARIYNSIRNRAAESEFARVQLPLFMLLVGKAQANGAFSGFSPNDTLDVQFGSCSAQSNSDDCGPLTAYAIGQRFRGNALQTDEDGAELRASYIRWIFDASANDRANLLPTAEPLLSGDSGPAPK
ncbi:hypothetical protein B0J12DRAFT_395397 [Macrophomina phaseolina]|uniref:Peptidase C48 SUMO/Sentrin/Ubl1 n=1 Tax=Macrophomina phaseolina TaxID=35725 RepID=A0ABQ8FS44_9PEZI|nr:hypothetical protein B0J12DRAFT_395397 [Macrophomina phaseolina]